MTFFTPFFSSLRTSLGALFVRIIDRRPMLIIYRARPSIAYGVNPLIVKLIEDSPDGETCRMALSEWVHSERPVIEYFRGIASSFRIEGPWHPAGRSIFPMGSLVCSMGVTARLDPVQTVALESEMRDAIEWAILRWIQDNSVQCATRADVAIDRSVADPVAIARIEERNATRPILSSRPEVFADA